MASQVQRILDEAEQKWTEDEEAKFQLELRKGLVQVFCLAEGAEAGFKPGFRSSVGCRLLFTACFLGIGV